MSWNEFVNSIALIADVLWDGTKPFIPTLLQLWWGITSGLFQVAISFITALF